MKKTVFLELTRYCNFSCRHCFIGAGSDGETLSLAKAKQIISHFPEDLEVIYLSGGEPFTQQPLLYDVLRYIHEKDFKNLQWVHLFTNGFWLKDEESIRKILLELKEFQLPIYFGPTYDQYHQERGCPPLKNFFLLTEIAKEVSSKDLPIINGFSQHFEVSWWQYLWAKYWELRHRRYWLMPMGKAIKEINRFPSLRLLNVWWLNNKHPCSSDWLFKGLFPPRKELHVYINVWGEVYGCCSQKHKILGNAVDTPISDLLAFAQTTPYFRALNDGGVRRVALLSGLTEKEIKRRLRFRWECDLCEELTEIFEQKEVAH